MKVAIATTQAPFVSGGAEFLAENLCKALQNAGHEATIISMPFIDRPDVLLENHILAARLMDINNSWAGSIDLCIGLKFPAYFMPHANKIIWALHQHRAAYDLFDTDLSPIKNDEEGRFIRDVVYRADCTYLPEAKRIYTIADNVTSRMKKYNNLSATTLYHPCPDMEMFYGGEYEDYILMPSRINATKRQMLAIQALALTKSDIKLCLLGKPDNPILMDDIQKIIGERKLEKRVQIKGYVSQNEKIKLYANARAVLFIPYDEDYGYITLEGMSAQKAIITAKDSGGPLEFVSSGETGMVVDPTAEAIAEAMDTLALDASLACTMGKAGKRRILDMEISWDKVVKEITR